MKPVVWLCILGFATSVFAQPPRAGERCDDEEDSCKETCTLEFGTSMDTRGRLASCMSTCSSRRRTCAVMAADEERRKTPAPKPPPRAPVRPVEETPQPVKTQGSGEEPPLWTSKKSHARTLKKPVEDEKNAPLLPPEKTEEPEKSDGSAWGK